MKEGRVKSILPHHHLRYSLGEFSDSYSSDDETSPRDRVLANSKGFRDFRIKDLKLSAYGRKEIEIAEQGKTPLNSSERLHMYEGRLGDSVTCSNIDTCRQWVDIQEVVLGRINYVLCVRYVSAIQERTVCCHGTFCVSCV